MRERVFVLIAKSKTFKIGSKIQLIFKLTQHSRDDQLMNSLVQYLGCGSYNVRSGGSACDFFVTKFSDINEKIIPLSVSASRGKEVELSRFL